MKMLDKEGFHPPATSMQMGPARLSRKVVQLSTCSLTYSTHPNTLPSLPVKMTPDLGVWERETAGQSGCHECLFFVWVPRELGNMVC